MKRHITTYLLALAIALCIPKLAVADPYIAPFTPPAHQLIVRYAGMYNTPSAPIIATALCESGLNPAATNHTSREFSVGIAQINLMAHKDITEAQARDVEFAAAFMAKNFKAGKQSMWVCYTKLYKKK